MTTKEEIKKYFNVSAYRNKGNIAVLCAFHEETRASASLNLDKGLFHCFKCDIGMNLEQLHKKLFKEKTNQDNGEEQEMNLGNNGNGNRLPLLKATKHNYESFLRKRGITEKTLKELQAYPVFDANEQKYGRLVFPNTNGSGGHGYVARTFINDPIKYLNSKNYEGETKGLFNFHKDKAGEVFLVEGIFDLCSLYEIGHKNVVSSLGAKLTEEQAYLLRKSTVFVLYDSDYAGWKGSLDAFKLLTQVGANPIILELPEFHAAKDVNELYIKHKKSLSNFISDSLSKYITDDKLFVEKLFSGKDRALKKYPTGIRLLDQLHKGGVAEGVHVFKGETSQGKTALTGYIGEQFAIKHNAKVLECQYEISKRQSWARKASTYSKYDWQVLEEYPERTEPEVKKRMDKLSENLKVTCGWTLAEIRRVAKDYDVIIVDYIQRMPGVTDDETTNINYNLNGLGDLARDQAKIVLVVSSIPIAAYEKEDSIRSKGSGNIEFQCQTLTSIKRQGQLELIINMLKNTRGAVGKEVIQANLGNVKFK